MARFHQTCFKCLLCFLCFLILWHQVAFILLFTSTIYSPNFKHLDATLRTYWQSWVKKPYHKNFKQITFIFKYDISSPPQSKELVKSKKTRTCSKRENTHSLWGEFYYDVSLVLIQLQVIKYMKAAHRSPTCERL